MINNPHKGNFPTVRNIFLKYTRFFGQFLADKLIAFGYLIRASNTFVSKEGIYCAERKAMHAQIIEMQQLKQAVIVFLEFGVYKGDIIQWWSEQNANANSKFVGFDTFTGLPEDWGGIKKGVFDVGGKIPEINDSRVRFEKGLFSDTVPPFLSKFKLENQWTRVIHLDADLYSSSIYVLVALKDYFKKGDIIIFDEFFSITKSDHEFRAWEDFQKIHTFKFKAIAKTSCQIAFLIE
jgi:Macrocin-O-methyltransferase (TylF)